MYDQRTRFVDPQKPYGQATPSSGPQPMRQPPPIRPGMTAADTASARSPELDKATSRALRGYADFDDEPTLDEHTPQLRGEAPVPAVVPQNENVESAEEAGRRIAAQVPVEEPAKEKAGVWSRFKSWWSGPGEAEKQAETAPAGPTLAESFDGQSYEGSFESKKQKMAGFREAILSGDDSAKADIVDRMQDDSDAPGELKDACEETLTGDQGRLAKMREFLKSDAGKNLTDDELVALLGYTGGDYRKLNAALRGDLSAEDKAKLGPYADAVTSGLEKLPAHEGTTYRGMSMSPERLQEYLEKSENGAPIQDKGFSSSSTSLEAAEHSLNKNYEEGKVRVVVEVRSKKGRDVTCLSQNPHEQEVLFSPGTRFKIVEKIPQPDGSYKFVVEDAPDEEEKKAAA